GLIAGIAIAVCIVLTHSRAAHIAVIAGAGVFISLSTIKRRGGWLASVAVAVLLAALAVWISLALGKAPQKHESLENRLAIWKVTAKMFADRPLTGVGTGNFQYRYLNAQSEFLRQPGNRKYGGHTDREKPRHAHNEFLETAAETGLPGLAAMLLLLAVFLWKNVSGQLRERNYLTLGVFCAALVFWLEMSVSISIHVPPSGAMFWILLGIGAPPGPDGESAARLRLDPPRLKWEIAVIAAAAAFALLDYSSGGFQARMLAYEGKRLIAQGRPMKAVIALNEAASRDPGDGETWFTRGVAFSQLGFFDRAISDFRTASETSNDPNLHYNLAMAHFNAGQVGAAIEEMQIMEEMLPSRQTPKIALAKFYFAIGDRESALKKLREAEELKKRIGNSQ
ncbi:MAG: O-antigen ligase family protein, partial [bacterium]